MRLSYQADMGVHGSGVTRKAVSALLSIPLLASCSMAVHAAPAREPQKVQAAAPQRRCDRTAEVILEPGERVIESVCGTSHDFILTSMNVVSLPRPAPEEAFGNFSPAYRYSKTDVSAILSRGLVDWEATAGAFFFLTKDRALTVVPSERTETVEAPVYRMPFDVKGITMDRSRDRMAYFAGYLFIAPPAGRAVVLSFSNGIDARYVDLPQENDSGFRIEERRLFFGKNTEIKIKENIDRVAVNRLP